MIIKSHRVRTNAGVSRLLRHLIHGDDNEHVEFVCGTESDVRDMHGDAKAHKSRFCVRHWIVSPHETMSSDECLSVLEKLSHEFGFEAKAAVVVEHQKPRSVPGAYDRHWHILVGEVDPVSGRVLSTSFDHVRHELIARWSEHELRHEFVLGRHSDAVLVGLRDRGLNKVANALAAVISKSAEPLPREGFTHAQHQDCKRKGIDLPALRAIVKNNWALALSPEELGEALGSHGLVIEVGDKPGTWIVQTQGGDLVGALHRLGGVRKRIAADFMSPKVDGVRTATREDVEKNTKSKRDTALALDRQRTELMLHLDHLEGQLYEELSVPAPSAPKVGSPKKFSEKVKRANAALTKAEDAQGHAWRKLQRFPQRRWWWVFWPGKRKRMARALTVLNQALAIADIAVQAKRQQVANVGFERSRKLRLAEKEHMKRLSDHSKREKLARERLSILEVCRDILADDPDAVSLGVQGIWRQAEQCLQCACGDGATDEASIDVEETTDTLRI
jgi:MobA/VirD2-like, nuclease domain